MLARWTCLAAAVTGCSFSHGVAVDPTIEDGHVEDIDAPPADARPDTPPGATCYGTGLFVDCYEPGTEPTAMWSF